jgi:hypothetical protein
MTINQYLEPDPMWQALGIDSQNKFLENIVVKGVFHNKVPDKIVKDFVVVEKILFYSYYYYPLIDEAFSKATRVFESAISHQIDELGLDKSNKIKNLDQKIQKLKSFTTEAIYKEWLKSKDIRNYFAHPKSGNLMGISIHRAFMQMVNIINTVFLDLKTVQTNEEYLDNLRIEAKFFFENLLTFDYGNQKILIWSIIPYSCFEKNGTLKSFWVFHPVLKSFPQNIQNYYFSKPICFRLEDVKISNTGFEAKDILSGNIINAIVTTDSKNIETNQSYKTMIETADQEVRKVHWSYLDHELTFEVVKFLYHECWE